MKTAKMNFSSKFVKLTVATIFALVYSVLAFADSKQPLLVGMELAYPPFEQVDASGEPSGVSVDMAKEFGKSIGREVKIVNIEWNGLIPALKTGKVDMLISSVTITDERKKVVDFSDPYMSVPLLVLINAKSNVKSASDLKKAGVKVAVKMGTTTDIMMKDDYPNVQVTRLAQFNEAVMEVVQGKADATAYDAISVLQMYAKFKDKTNVLKESIGTPQYLGAVFKQGDNDLLPKFNSWLKQAQNSDFFQKEEAKYLPEVSKTLKEKGIKDFFDVKQP